MKPKMFLSAFALFAILLSACGSSATSTPTARPTEASTAEVTSEATVEATSEATSEATTEATSEATSEATREATREATSEATSESTAEATSESTANPSSSSSSSSDLAGSNWMLTSMNGTTVSEDTPITVSFTDDELSGNACNSFNGPYTMDGDTLDVGEIVSTMKACTEPAGLTELETTFLDTLGKATTIERTATRLMIGTADDPEALVFKPDTAARS